MLDPITDKEALSLYVILTCAFVLTLFVMAVGG